MARPVIANYLLTPLGISDREEDNGLRGMVPARHRPSDDEGSLPMGSTSPTEEAGPPDR